MSVLCPPLALFIAVVPKTSGGIAIDDQLQERAEGRRQHGNLKRLCGYHDNLANFTTRLRLQIEYEAIGIVRLSECDCLFMV